MPFVPGAKRQLPLALLFATTLHILHSTLAFSNVPHATFLQARNKIIGRAHVHSSLASSFVPHHAKFLDTRNKISGRVHATVPRLRMNVPRSPIEGNESSNAALRLLLSRRGALTAAAASAAVLTSRSSPSYAESSLPALDLSDAFKAGVLKAPGKLVVLRDDTVEQSPSDLRKYRAMTLPNGLRVLLASDPLAETAAAALDVHVGHFSDPDSIPGLAHFCEHMLFLGTEKYPQESYLQNFVSSHGGSCNAYTSGEDTNYFFSVNNDSFEEALDIFAQFFISPLFTASATDRELNAIESEHSKNLQADNFRISQTEKLRANQRHPFAKFGTGNLITLKEQIKANNIDLQKQLLEYYRTYYSANQMTLVVCGKQDLDTLQKWVVSRFSPVPNADRPPPEFAWQGKVKPFDQDASKVLYKIVPVKDARNIYLEWIVPYKNAEERNKLIYAHPDYLISSVLGHEGKGSLLSYLKNEKGWVTSLASASFSSLQDFNVYGVDVGLTEEGMKHREEIVEAVYSLLNVIRKEGLPKYLGDELEQLGDIAWRFSERSDSSGFCSRTAAVMHKYTDPRRYLSGPAKVTKVDMQLVKELLEQLTPETCLVSYISRGEKTDKTERWYGVRYASEPVGDRMLAWSNPRAIPALKVPSPNPFIPKDFTIKMTGESLSDEITPPAIIRDDERWRVHFKPDKRYNKPKAYAYLQLTCSNELFGEGTTPRKSALTKLLKASYADALNEYAYDATVAGLNYDLAFTIKGPQISFSGYNDKLASYVEYVSKAIASHVPNSEAKFARLKDSIARGLEGFATQQPYQHAVAYSNEYTSAPGYTPDDVLQELRGLTLKDLQEFAGVVWKEAYGEALVQGNVDQAEAMRMVAALDDAIKFKPLPRERWAQSRYVQLPVVRDGYGCLLDRSEPSKSNPNSACVVQIQSSNRDVKEQAGWQVLAAMLSSPFFSSLRTKQQLGYIVGGGSNLQDGVRSLTFTVQSSVADAPYLTARVFEFLSEFFAEVEKMSDKEVSVFVENLVDKKLEKEKKLSAEVAKHWSEISTRQYVYDRAQREAAALRKVTKQDLVRIYKEAVLPQGSERRILVTQINSQSNNQPARKGGPAAQGTLILPANAVEFRTTSGFFPKETPELDGMYTVEPLPSK